MAIQVRRGNESDFTPSKMVAGEPAVTLDSGKVYMTIAPGNVKQLMTTEEAESYVERAETAADNAETSETNAENSATTATTNAGLSKSYAVGTGGVVREGDDTDCAKYYYEQAAAIVDVEIATTEKAGIVKPDGTTITVTADGTISSVGGGVTGIKGDSESEYRTGNVSISANNVGAYSKSEVDVKVAELEVLGWNVPNECPIQNTFSNGVLTQKVGRVDLGSLTWGTTSSNRLYSSGICNEIKRPSSGSVVTNMYNTKLLNDTAGNVEGNVNDNAICCGSSNGNLAVFSSAYVGNPSGFKSFVSGTYLYYELATYVTRTVCNTKSVSEVISDAWTSSKTYSVGEYCIYNNSLWKCLIQNSNTTPTEGSYWTSVSVGSELKTHGNRLDTLNITYNANTDRTVESNRITAMKYLADTYGSCNAVIRYASGYFNLVNIEKYNASIYCVSEFCYDPKNIVYWAYNTSSGFSKVFTVAGS